jgi:hypothetical protein
VPYFFFSYSRTDAADQHVYEFFDDLAMEVAARTNLGTTEPGFLDRQQQPGVEWSTNTGHALGTCNVFVPLFSPNFFTSHYCGKEWHAFATRLATDRARTGAVLPSIVPVWWVPPGRHPPDVADGLQDTRALFGSEHEKYGARYLKQLKENRDAYTGFLVKLTELILAAGRNPPAAMTPIDLNQQPDAFADISDHTSQSAVLLSAGGTGPKKRVTFVVVAAGYDRMQAIRAGSLGIYGTGATGSPTIRPSPCRSC